ncbi:MAG: glycosyltransferase family 4 protein [Nostoc sp. NMS1]|uniref:glycosyltransferase family 4 protein n=1 Tax=Nostoc sp. NMS1 TaxID=2815388 RepID=UPI0025F52CC8|nr:glycosyltransferase family 4 protein [Nostoc sp. NMS1]MBN3906211.1 glycosyltransferase family 4 protein [Nostoc sp. NMS1]
MKVAIFVHCFFPEHFYGTETYTLDLAINLQKLGHEPIVVSARFPGEPKTDSVVTYYEYEGLPVYCIDKNYIPNTRIKDTYYQPEIRKILREILVDIQPDIVHVTHLINHTAILLEVINELQISTVATLTDFYGFCFNNKLEAADGSLCVGPNRKRTNCLSCLLKARSNFSTASLAERYVGQYPQSRITAEALNLLIKIPGFHRGVVAGTVLDVTCRPDILSYYYRYYRAVIAPTVFLRKAYVRNGLTVPIYDIKFGVNLPILTKSTRPINAPIRFGFIGQMTVHKGVDILVDAFCRLPYGAAELYLFGSEKQDPDYSLNLHKKANGYTVKFCGTFPKEEMLKIFSNLDFLVIPSRWYENSPLVLLNSLASHTPVIVSDVEGMTEFVEEGKNGYTFKMGNVQELEQIMQKIIQNPKTSLKMSQTTEYPRTTEIMTQEVIKVYQDVLQSCV